MIPLPVILEDYKRLYQHFLNISEHHINQSSLDQLKIYYNRIINSKRSSENIKDLKSLIRILEKRGLLAYDDIEPLQYITNNFIRDKELQEKLEEYNVRIYTADLSKNVNLYEGDGEIESYNWKQSHPSKAFVSSNKSITNVEEHDQLVYEPQQLLCSSDKPSTFFNKKPSRGYIETLHLNQEEEIQFLVICTLSERLGRNWKDLARWLKIRESEIDDIEVEFRHCSKEKCCKVLKMFFSKTRSYCWKVTLLSALEKIRRRDLKEMIEELLEQNI